jgi:hypothetical protein
MESKMSAYTSSPAYARQERQASGVHLGLRRDYYLRLTNDGGRMFKGQAR